MVLGQVCVMFNREKVFPVPDTRRAEETYNEPPAVQRHYLVIRDAMMEKDAVTVGNRQLRLLRSGFEIPITLKQCNKLLEKYRNASEPSQ